MLHASLLTICCVPCPRPGRVHSSASIHRGLPPLSLQPVVCLVMVVFQGDPRAHDSGIFGEGAATRALFCTVTYLRARWPCESSSGQGSAEQAEGEVEDRVAREAVWCGILSLLSRVPLTRVSCVPQPCPQIMMREPGRRTVHWRVRGRECLNLQQGLRVWPGRTAMCCAEQLSRRRAVSTGASTVRPCTRGSREEPDRSLRQAGSGREGRKAECRGGRRGGLFLNVRRPVLIAKAA
ncbi:hypothetical protein C8Q76DRAFT_147161 [Earliella scabrosa]|nr:hypothetical protein C8Q76DRAFT_147161 [Earliella scabrosa]